MKKLYIELTVQDGERKHTHRVLTQTTCEDTNFAAQWYAAHFWGESKREDDWWSSWGGEIAIRLVKVVELSETEYEILNKVFYA